MILKILAEMSMDSIRNFYFYIDDLGCGVVLCCSDNLSAIFRAFNVSYDYFFFVVSEACVRYFNVFVHRMSDVRYAILN